MNPDEIARLRGDVGLQVDRCLREAEPGAVRGDIAVGCPEGPVAFRSTAGTDSSGLSFPRDHPADLLTNGKHLNRTPVAQDLRTVPARVYAPTMNRIDRLYALVEELRAAGPRGRTARQLAERFELSVGPSSAT